jgi:cysteine desulfurase/selenocysteine lyase
MKNVRNNFPILDRNVNGNRLAYLDNASTSQKPQVVLDAVRTFETTFNANIYRGIHTFGEEATQHYENVRAQVARFIGAADVSEIIFTKGTTESINFVAAAWALNNLQPDDEIVLTQLEHHANLIPWQQVAKKTGAKLVFIPVNDDGFLDYSNLETLINDRTKLVAISHVSNAIGTHVDVARIVSWAKKVGAKILIDAAQSVPHQRINVQRLGCDFLTFSGHKMLAPTGVGILYINKELHDAIEPYQFGGGMVFNVDWQESTWAQAPHKFEAGTPPIAQVIGLGAAIAYLESEVDFDALQSHEAELCSQLIDGLQKIAQVRILGPLEQLRRQGHLVSFVVDGIHAHDVAAYLDQQGVAVRAGHHCAQPLARKLGYDASVRVSFYLYNSAQDVQQLLDALHSLLKAL